jgi:hypothetical protein
MRLGKTDVAGASQVQDPDPGGDCSFDAGALLVLFGECRLRLTLASRCKGLMFLLWAQRQKPPIAAGTLCLQRTGTTVSGRETHLEGGSALPVIGTPAPALVPGRTDCDLPIPIEDEVLQGEALTGLSLPLIIPGSRPQERDAIGPATGDELIGRDIAGVDKMGIG